jgi:hypothetical protein
VPVNQVGVYQVLPRPVQGRSCKLREVGKTSEAVEVKEIDKNEGQEHPTHRDGVT